MRVSECQTPTIDTRFVVCDDRIEQMFDDGRQETIESPSPRVLGPPKSPFFRAVVTHYTKDDEESSVDIVARGEMVEAELDSLIRRRDDKRRETDGERLEEELWQASERRHAANRREEYRAAWCRPDYPLGGCWRDTWGICERCNSTSEETPAGWSTNTGRGEVQSNA